MIRPPVVQNRQARRARVRGIATQLRSLGYGSALALLLASGVAQAQQPQPAPRTQRPEAQRPEAQRPEQQRPEGEDEIEVIGKEEKPPVPTRPSLPRFTGSLLRTPQVITVIPQGLLQEQGATTLRDALRNVTGIGVSAGEGGAQGDNFTLRGYSAQNDTFIDGVRDRGSYFRDSFNLEAVEVVKGPSSSYFGRGSTGGVINQVSKSPLQDFAASGGLAGGNGPYLRGTGDFNVPLGENTAFRLNLMGHDQGVVDRDGPENRRYGVAPSLTFGLGTPTQFTLSYLHQRENNVPDYGLPYVGGTNGALAKPATSTAAATPATLPTVGEPIDVKRDSFYGIDGGDQEQTELDVITGRLEFQLSDTMRLRNTTSYGHLDRHSVPTAPRFCTADDVNKTSRPPNPNSPNLPQNNCPTPNPAFTSFPILQRNRPERESTDGSVFNQTDVVTELALGPTTHTVAAGVDAARESFSIARYSNVAGSSLGFDTDPLPGFGVTRTRSGRTNTVALSAGGFVSDQVKLGELWELVGGVRWDLYKVRFTNDFPALENAQGLPDAAGVRVPTGSDFKTTDRRWSHRVGVLFHPSEAQNYYASYATSFNPSGEALSLSAATKDTPPEKNRSLELGAKWLLFEDQLKIEAALFQIDKTDARETDPLTNLSVLSGQQRVRGFEVGASGRLSEHWEVFAGYTLLKSKLLESELLDCVGAIPGLSKLPIPQNCPEGNELARTPKHSASLWTSFTPFGGKWTFAGGPTYVSERFSSSNANRSLVPSYVRWDSMIGYQMSETMSLRLNIQNITDTEYFVEVGGGHAVPAPGRSFILSSDFSY